MFIAPISLARPVPPFILPRPLRRAALALARLAGGTVLLAGAYLLKMRLGLDLVPGVDVLPDAAIMAAIHAVSHTAPGLAGL